MYARNGSWKAEGQNCTFHSRSSIYFCIRYEQGVLQEFKLKKFIVVLFVQIPVVFIIGVFAIFTSLLWQQKRAQLTVICLFALAIDLPLILSEYL